MDVTWRCYTCCCHQEPVTPWGPADICRRGASGPDASGTPCVHSRHPAVLLGWTGLSWAGRDVHAVPWPGSYLPPGAAVLAVAEGSARLCSSPCPVSGMALAIRQRLQRGCHLKNQRICIDGILTQVEGVPFLWQEEQVRYVVINSSNVFLKNSWGAKPLGFLLRLSFHWWYHTLLRRIKP